MFKWKLFSKKALEYLAVPVRDHKRIVITYGSVRSSKTVNNHVKLLNYLNYYDTLETTAPIGVFGKTLGSLQRNVLNDLFSILGQKNYKVNWKDGTVLIKGKYPLQLFGCNDKSAEETIRGITLAGAFIDELTLVPINVFQQILNRCSVDGSRIFATTNPDSPNHWVYEDYLINEDKKNIVESWLFTLRDNLTLGEEYLEFLKTAYQGVFYERFVLGRWIVAEGLVYNTFKPDEHIVNQADTMALIQNKLFKDCIVGVDWGWTHPTAVNLYGVTQDFKYYQIGELYEPEIDASNVIDWLKEQQKILGIHPRWVVCDNSRPEQNRKLQLAGYHVIDEKPSVQGSIDTVRAIINFGRLRVIETAKNTIKELSTYRYPSKEERLMNKSLNNDQPLKENDDAMDATRYILNWYEMKFNKNNYRKKLKAS